MKTLGSFINEVFQNRYVLIKMANRDFKTRYIGSNLGLIWGFVQPSITILVYWVVFEFGLKAGSRPDHVPFVVWMITGMIPWLYFTEALSGGTSSIIEYSYLVKKIVFKVKLLPVIKSLSALYVFFCFTILQVIVLISYGFTPSVFWLQGIFYLMLMYMFLLGVILITSSVTPFFRDLPQIITMALQLGFWITPIIWDYRSLPKTFWWLIKFNPMFYIVEGYRNSFIYKSWFWQQDIGLLIFSVVSFLILILGTKVFNKLELHFADVL